MKELLFQFAPLLITAVFGFLFVWGRYRYQCWKESKAFRKMLKQQSERYARQQKRNIEFMIMVLTPFLIEKGIFKNQENSEP